MLSYFKGDWNNRKPNKAHLDKFYSLGAPICLYDLGAFGGAPPPFCWVLDGIRLVNFEPNVSAELEGTGKNCNIAIGPKEMGTLFINRRQTTSSLLPPCKKVVNRYDFSDMFPEGAEIFETVSEVETETIGLDDAVKKYTLPFPDFLKIDVQGLTFEVLESGTQAIDDSVLGLQVEVEFIETYQGQKTFGAVHGYLEKHGFEIFKLTNLSSWKYKTAFPLKMCSGQDVYCDLLYLRSISHVDECPEFWTTDKIIKFIKLCLLYDLTDTAAAFIEKFIVKELIDKSSVEEIRELTMNWTGALDYFYQANQVRSRARLFKEACVLMLQSMLPKRVYITLRSLFNRM